MTAQHRASTLKLWHLESTLIRTRNNVYVSAGNENGAKLLERRSRNLEARELEEQRQKEERRQLAAADAAATAATATASGAPPISAPGRGGRGGGGGGAGGRSRLCVSTPTPEPDDPYDHYQREVKVLGDVQAYHDIARVRFVDYIDMVIWGELLEVCKTGLLEELKLQLGLRSPGGKCHFPAVRRDANLLAC